MTNWKHEFTVEDLTKRLSRPGAETVGTPTYHLIRSCLTNGDILAADQPGKGKARHVDLSEAVLLAVVLACIEELSIPRKRIVSATNGIRKAWRDYKDLFASAIQGDPAAALLIRYNREADRMFAAPVTKPVAAYQVGEPSVFFPLQNLRRLDPDLEV